MKTWIKYVVRIPLAIIFILLIKYSSCNPDSEEIWKEETKKELSNLITEKQAICYRAEVFANALNDTINVIDSMDYINLNMFNNRIQLKNKLKTNQYFLDSIRTRIDVFFLYEEIADSTTEIFTFRNYIVYVSELEELKKEFEITRNDLDLEIKDEKILKE